MACAKLTDPITFGSYQTYDKSARCAGAADVELQSPLFFGRDDKDKPIFATMSYKQFAAAKYGMIGASALAIGLGLTSLILAMKLSKLKKSL